MSATETVERRILGHGAYLAFARSTAAEPAELRAAPIRALAERLGFRSEFAPTGEPPRESIAFLRRRSATRGAIEDPALLGAEAIVHVASPDPEPVDEFCAEAVRLLAPLLKARVLRGVIREKSYTGAAMHDFAYAHAVVQRPGTVMPTAFLLPLSKSSDWWSRGWMERNTYFLPRFGEDGRMTSLGHALAAERGIPVLLRRTYASSTHPAPPGAYDFVNYFECADDDVATFHEVCARLRDVRQNPEWRFVVEGPTWTGRRVADWADLFDDLSASSPASVHSTTDRP